MFDPYLEELHESIKVHGGEQIDFPIYFQERLSEKGNSKINSWLWNVPGFRRWRVTRLDAGDKLQVLNSVAYPLFTKDQPIMGIDLLWFGFKSQLVAILDFQPLIQDQNYFDQYFDGLKTLKESFPEFKSDKKIHLYDPNQYFSPWLLFCRGNIEQAENTLPKVFSAFLNCYWELFNKPSMSTYTLDSTIIRNSHISYDKYSAEKDPAHALFSGFFGKKWSDEFVKEFLFPLSISNPNVKN